MNSTIRPATATDIGKLTLLGAVWGSSFLFIELALEGFGPLTIAAGRVSIAAIGLWLVSILQKNEFPRQLRTWVLLTLIGFLNSALPFFLIGWGQQYITAGQTALLMATASFVALILSHFTTRDDRMNIFKVSGVVIGFAGVVVLIGFQAIAGESSKLIGQLAIMAAAACYATSAVMTRFLPTITPLVGSSATMLTAMVYMLPLAFFMEFDSAPHFELKPLLALIFLSLFSTALAFILRFQIILQVGATFMAQVSYLIPLFGVFWSWVFLDEAVGLSMLAALALILVGINVSRLQPKTRLLPSAGK